VTFLPESRFKPYIGVGGGGVRGRLDIGGNSGDETDGALQGMAGVRYKLNDRGDLSLGYKGLITFPKGIDRITSHAIVASYTFAF
jgi:opacity protein-like surface antigen